jgi:RNA-directed DNA polymerase
MLTALENGVRGGKWHSLIDKVYARDNLEAAYRRVAANGGAAEVDHVTIDASAQRLDGNLDRLSRTLREGTYRLQAVKRVYIPKPGSKEKRPLGIPTIRDRVAQAALRNVMEPIFEKDFAKHSYGFRPNRGCKDALRRVDALLKAGYNHVLDVDLKSYFDTIPHEPLLDLIRRRISDSRVLSLVALFLKQRIMDDLKVYEPEEGSPQGAVISPLLSNIYLDPLDHLMAERGFEMVRYADDLVVMCRSREEAEEALKLVDAWTREAELVLHPEKTCIVTAEEGFDFLGYRFKGGRRWPRKKSLTKLKDTIRTKTKRNNGHSLDTIIADVNVTLMGWFEYFKHSGPSTMKSIDGWVRMRLRSILRHRRGLKGRGHGRDHQRWPNAYFVSHGLFSLKTAHELTRQSSLR